MKLTFARFLAVLAFSLIAACSTTPAPNLTDSPTPTPMAETSAATATPQRLTPTVAPSATPEPTATVTPPPPPRIGTAEQAEFAFLDDRMPHLFALLEAQQAANLRLPDPTLTLEVSLNGSQLAWDNYWCASDPEILAANLARLEMRYTFDGQSLTDEQAYTTTRTAETAACQITAFYLEDLSPGQTYTLQYTYIVLAPINDGTQNFTTGEYTLEYLLSPVEE